MAPAAVLLLVATGLVGLGVVHVCAARHRPPQPAHRRRLSPPAGLFALLAVAAVVLAVPMRNGWLLLVNLLLVRPVARRVTRAGVRALIPRR